MAHPHTRQGFKLKVLGSCVSASLVYGCETWGTNKIKNAETAFRQGLKAALSIRDCTNNEIVYIESGEFPLEIRITKQQIKFWAAIEDIIETYPNHYISKLVKIGEDTEYVKYYKNLMNTYTDTKTCNDTMKSNYRNLVRDKFGRI